MESWILLCDNGWMFFAHGHPNAEHGSFTKFGMRLGREEKSLKKIGRQEKREDTRYPARN